MSALFDQVSKRGRWCDAPVVIQYTGKEIAEVGPTNQHTMKA